MCGVISSLVSVLAWVTGLVVQELQQVPESGRDEGTEKWTNPVDPVVVREGGSSDTWTERSGWVKTSTSVVDTDQVTNEQGKTNGEWSHVSSSVLLNSHEQDGDTENSSTESLEEDTLGSGSGTTETVSKSNWTWSHGGSGTSSSHTGNHLGEDHEGSSDWWNGTDKDKSSCDSWVQVTTRNSEEDEDTDSDGNTETEGDHNELGWVGTSLLDRGVLVGNLGNDKGRPQEKESTTELTNHGDKVVSQSVGETQLGGSWLVWWDVLDIGLGLDIVSRLSFCGSLFV